MKGNAFGHAVLTNIGTLGLETGFAPLPCPIHCMFIICTGKITKKPVVINDKIEIREMMNTVWTVDHRFGDATLAVKFIDIIKGYTEDPENFNLDNYPENPPYNQITANHIKNQ